MVDKEKFAEEDAMGYNIYIVAKNFELTDPMRQHIWDKLSKIEKFHNHIMDVHVTLDIERVEHVCVITCHFNHIKVKVEGRSTDMYASIDMAIQKLQRLFRRWKGKIQDYHKKAVNSVEMAVAVYGRPPPEVEDEPASEEEEIAEFNEEIDEQNLEKWMPGKVLSSESRILKTLKTDEAIMKMELSNDRFMLYRDEQDSKLKLIYRRDDQNYGIIQAEG
ncbi:MAG: Ribosome-associated factor Y [Chlamydiae bacterium]|nr:Ribosome-associated factor Y [Chlamydiota bacterium]